MIAILGKGFVPCLTSSNNQNLQLLSFQKIYTLLGFYETCDREATTTRGCHLGYTDTLKQSSEKKGVTIFRTSLVLEDVRIFVGGKMFTNASSKVSIGFTNITGTTACT